MRAGEFIDGERVHSRAYTDAAVFALERERLFGRAWLYLAHESQLREAGDFVTARLADVPVLLTRHTDGTIRGSINKCAHRGAQVCQHAAGRQRRFTCPYHGWTFGTDGRLLAVPMRAGYDALDLDDPRLSLAPVPRLAAYRGFVFGSLAAEGPDLAAWLGPIASALDDMVDRAPGGELEMAGGVHRHSYRANWKLQIENLQDFAHPIFAHESSNAAPAKREADRAELRADDVMAGNAGASFEFIERAGVSAFPGGHSFIGGLPIPQPIPPAAEAAYRAALEARHGAKRAAEILAISRHQAIVYPSLAVQAQFQQLKVIRPVRADYTEIDVYCFRMKGAPPEYHRAAVTFVNAANAPASPILTDDLAIYERAQAAMTASPGWLWFGCGAGRDAPDNRGGLHGPGSSELAMRNQFRAWGDYLFGRAA